MRGHGRMGGVYVAVLAVSMFVALIGLTVMATVRSQRRAVDALVDTATARQYADSGVQVAAQWIASDSNWRTSRVSGVWLNNQVFDGGTITVSGTDPVDGNLSNRPYDKLVIRSEGRRGAARQIEEVTMVAQGTALDALSLAVHTAGELHVNSGATLTVQGAAASTNGTFRSTGTVAGAVKCLVSVLPGTVTGGLTIVTLPTAMPGSGVEAMYVGLGTAISPSAGLMDKVVLTPTLNPWGAGNADGVYVITTSQDLMIKRTRINGTLVVVAPGRTVTIDQGVLIQPARSDYPALIVDGNLVLQSDSTAGLSESSAGVNFNPAGAPYQGATDSDMTDTYPCEIGGLVHVKGTVTLDQNSLVRGMIICESGALADAVYVRGNASVVYTASLATSPPMGYTKSVTMAVEAGSYKQVVLP